MKLYHDYKKQFNTLILIILFLFPLAFSCAQSAQNLQDQINQKNSDIDQLEKEIASFQSQLDSLGQQKSSLSSSLKALDLTKKKLDADITLTQKKIDKTNFTIQGLSSNISDKEDSIKNNLDSISLEIKNINESEQSSLVENILSKNDFSMVWDDIDNIITVRERIRADIITLKQTKGALEDTRKVTIDAKKRTFKTKISTF